MPIENKELFLNRKFIFLILFLLLAFQLVFSFLFPSCGYNGTGHQWLSLPELISHKRSPLSEKDSSIIDKIYPFLSNYTVNADGGEYILLAKDFPNYYFKNVIYIPRPLYSFLIAAVAFLPHFLFNYYATFFAAAILLNFIVTYGIVLLFYSFVEKIITKRAAFLSCLLFIFSPFTHSWLVQPVAEMFGAFIIMASLYFIYDYVKRPSTIKLIIFSLIIGTFMLAKEFYVPTIFILILAIIFKRYKEGILFFLIHLIPVAFWYIFVTRFLRLPYYMNAVENFNSGVWLLNIFSWPWYQTAKTLINVLPQFISSIIQGFLLLPVIFALIGFKNLRLEKKEILCLSFLISFLILFFVANFYFPRHASLLFPMIYPLAVLGIDRIAVFLEKKKKCYSTTFYFLSYALLIIISSVNVCKFVVC